jgi:phospholipase C
MNDPYPANPPSRRGLAAVVVVVLLISTIAAVAYVERYPVSASPCASVNTSSAPTTTPVRHLFVIIKENHAFENYFGTYPGVVGGPPNGSFPTSFSGGGTISPFPLNATSTPDLPHDRGSEIADLNGGRNDEFVAEAALDGAAAPQDAVGYYTQAQLGDYFALAHNYTLDDMFFSGVLGPTLPNRLFDLAATSGGWTNDSNPPAANMSFPTVLGQLSAAGIPWNYDYSGSEENLTPLEIPALTNSSCSMYQIQPVASLAAQVNGSAPAAVTFIDPSHDPLYSEHPPQNVTLGAEWTLSVLQTIFESSIGSSSAAVIFWDEAGGFWDPVTPPSEPPLGDGIRIPFLVVSPWTPAGVVDHTTMDPASVLAFIDQNWGLPPLNARTAAAPSLASFFNFSRAPRPYEAPGSSISLASDGSTPVFGPDVRPVHLSEAALVASLSSPVAARSPWDLPQSICAPHRLSAPWGASGSRSITRSSSCSSPRERSSPSR